MADDEFQISPARLRPADAVTVSTMVEAVLKLRAAKRTIICPEDQVAPLEAAIKAEGLEHLTEVIGSRHIQPGTAYMFASSILGGKTLSRSWVESYDADRREDCGEFDDGGPISG